MHHQTVTSSVIRKQEGIVKAQMSSTFTAATAAAPLTLSEEQAPVGDQITSGGSCVVMGPGGCGKSFLIRWLAKWAERENVNMAVTSLTGAAALVLQVPGATTLHRWAGVGLGKDSVADTLKKMWYKKHLVERWQTTQLLVIDEVSMLSQKLFELLDGVARAIRKEPNLPFGGLRVVCFGDFYQLAPVPDRGGGGLMDTSGRFCFESAVWPILFPPEAHFQLTQLVRQNGDPVFQKVLTEIREGKCSAESAAYLAACMVSGDGNAALAAGDDVAPIKLFPRNEMVDRENDLAYARLRGFEHTFDQIQATDLTKWIHEGSSFGSRDAAAVRKATKDTIKTAVDYLQKDAPCAVKLKLKVGTVVMLLTNLDVDAGLANGALGKVVRFELPPDPLTGEDIEGVGVVACTLNKAKKSEYGFGDHHQLMPVVKFANGHVALITPHWWQSSTLPSVGIMQLPLKLGYAISTHKAQGLTCDSAVIDAGGNNFAPGQIYVAISRVRSGKGLRLVGFDKSKICAHPRVVAFHAKLAAAQAALGASSSTSATQMPHLMKKRPFQEDKKVVVVAPAVKRQSVGPAVSLWGSDDDDA